METILQARGLKKYYGKGETQVRALDGVDLDIERGKFTAIIGTSGSGKSTLLNMLGGLDTPTEGSIRVGDTELAKLNSEQATIFRRKQIGFIFQNYNRCRCSACGKISFSQYLWTAASRTRRSL